MPRDIIYIDRNDLIYPVKLVIDKNIEWKFSVPKVVEILEKIGFKDSSSKFSFSSRSSRAFFVKLNRGYLHCQVSSVEVAFSDNIQDQEIEQIKTNLYSLLVSRVSILINAAEQNSSSALINLMQNQRRACVSDSYYALHNSIAALQEHYLFQENLDESRIPSELSRETAEEESRLGHCSPAIAKPLVNTKNLDILWEKDVEDILTSTDLKASSNARDKEPHRSPFIWLSLMLREVTKLNSEEEKSTPQHKHICDLVKQIYKKIKTLEMSSLGIGGKNDVIEKDFKQIHQTIIQMNNDLIIKPESTLEKTEFYKNILIFTDFLMFSQILRLSGDYDSSFEVKFQLKDIVDWILLTARFVSTIRNFIEQKPDILGNCIKYIPTNFDHRLLDVADSLTKPNLISSFGGAIQAQEFNIVDIVRKLHREHGYNLIQSDGRTENVNLNSESVVVWKTIPGIERLVCFMNLNKNGLFWFEVVDDAFERSMSFSRRIPVNAYYLDQLIDEYFLKIDFLSTLKPSSIIYRTTSELNQLDESKGYAFMLFNLIESYYLSSDLLKFIKKIFESKGLSQDELIIYPIWIKSKSQISRQNALLIPTIRLKDLILNDNVKNKLILILPLINLSTQDKDHLEKLIKNRIQRIYEQDIVKIEQDIVKVRVEFITPESIDNTLLNDDTQLEALISTFVEKMRKENNLDSKTTEVSANLIKVSEGGLTNEDLIEEESE